MTRAASESFGTLVLDSEGLAKVVERDRHAIDAMVSATALISPAPVTVLTSDPDDLTALCGKQVTIVKV
ncbi:hypothetical protein ACFO4E_02695 [Nocardiopsis mangrovi]|uniref:DNA-binding protein n=1 Tax=Nocardiopsis mangrovi TaxID=1179818 RepID=A0ABV9DS13_9ACTN